MSNNRLFKRNISWTKNLSNLRRKVFLPNLNKKKLTIQQKPNLNECCTEIRKGPRINKLGIQMLSKPLHNHIFKGIYDTTDPVTIEKCKANLDKFNLSDGNETKPVSDVNFKLPPLEGKNILEHFENIAEKQAKPYRELVQNLICDIPDVPKKWVLQEGWTRYTSDGIEQVPHPHEDAIIFDVEVCMMCGQAPTLATAVSHKAWYAWISKSLIDGSSKPVIPQHYTTENLIPFERTKHKPHPRIIIGHNVSYDRARIKEQYRLEQTGTRFLDTMSLHISISGVTSYQRIALKSSKNEDIEDEAWKEVSSLNNLRDVYKLYCNRTISKETRDIFVEGTLSEIKENFQKVMNYCSNDVKATHDVLKVVFPMFLTRFPHPATLAGMLELSTAYLPVNNNWTRYIEDSQQCYNDLDIERKVNLIRRADHACHLFNDDAYKKDIWMWDQDWSVKNLKTKKVKEEHVEHEEPDVKFAKLWSTKGNLAKLRPILPGYPNWYRKLCTKPGSTPEWVPTPHLISTSMQITPKLLNLTWEGYPLHFIRSKGWGFLVPFSDELDIERKLPLEQLLMRCPLPATKDGNSCQFNEDISAKVQENLMRKEYYSRVKKTVTPTSGSGVWCNTVVEECCYFFKLPHKNGASCNVGNPLSRDFLNKFSENVLEGNTESAEKILSIARMLSYWRNNRDRVNQQMVVWLNKNELPKELRENFAPYGAIIPMVVVTGTLTRRAVEPTWMTASNAHVERVGSELRSMIQAPPGYSLIGADVDSQELWIAALLGDAGSTRIQGGTPFGWMTLIGSKSNGSDMHSVTAKAVGISRDHAKVLNYARIYGAGQNFAERLLKQFNPKLSETEAKAKALKMFGMTKGKRIYFLKDSFRFDFPDQAYNKWQAFEIAKSFNKTVEEMFEKPSWVGGTESAMFNKLEEIASMRSPVTPFLECRLSRSIEPKAVSDDRYLPTRVNWVVQSGAVDFLHLMLVSMRWLMKERARFCLSFHDEIRYLVPDDYKYRAALSMHVTNLLTRAFCVAKLGLNDLPQSVAFFSSVEVDKVLRKDAQNDCVTPSNPHGLEKGYNIPHGESLDIHQAIEKAGGYFECWYKDDDEIKK